MGGRPKEDKGHVPKRVSLDKEISDALNKIPRGHQSKFIEDIVRPVFREFDPGPACEVLERIDTIINSEVASALAKWDFEKAAALTALGNSLETHRCLCRVPNGKNASQKKH